jgi:hypothetical protein
MTMLASPEVRQAIKDSRGKPRPRIILLLCFIQHCARQLAQDFAD